MRIVVSETPYFLEGCLFIKNIYTNSYSIVKYRMLGFDNHGLWLASGPDFGWYAALESAVREPFIR